MQSPCELQFCTKQVLPQTPMVHSEWKNRSIDLDLSKILFVSLIINTGLGQVYHSYFGPLRTPRRLWGAMGSFGGSTSPSIAIFFQGPILTMKLNAMGHNNLQHYVFEVFWSKLVPLGKKIGSKYGEKWGMQKSNFFSKNTISKFQKPRRKQIFTPRCKWPEAGKAANTIWILLRKRELIKSALLPAND